MARTTIAAVRAIIETSLDDTTVQIFIDDADLIVTDLVGSETSLSDARKEQIERYLTAHLITITRQRQLQEHEVEDARERYVGSFGKGLEGSTYGQTVLTLDTSGKIKASINKRTITFWAIPPILPELS